MPDYKKFFEYWHDLYGTGLKIAGWHLNGELEDFDNFFDSAVESMDGVTIMRTFQGKTYTELWEGFGDVPMNPETECIEVAWCGFPKAHTVRISGIGSRKPLVWPFMTLCIHDSRASQYIRNSAYRRCRVPL